MSWKKLREKHIARIFPTKTSMSPVDPDVYFGSPELFMPDYDEIHISVVFTWDIEKASWLKKQWEQIAPVKIGGPAIDGEPLNGFKAGLYLREGVTITSRGCPNRCSWCFVKRNLIELNDFPEGSNILDNNILACSNSHLDKVFDMLSKQKKVVFSGGLEAGRITEKIAERLRGLYIYQIFTAYDDKSRKNDLKKAAGILKKYFNHINYRRCYGLVGFRSDTFNEAEERLLFIYNLGLLPFAMLYRDKDGKYPEPEKEWRRFQRTWCRPAAIKTKVKELNK